MNGFEVSYLAEDGAQRRLPLADVWAARFEVMAPVRRFAARKGQRHLPGHWWSATNGGHVGYESWLERDHVMALNFDPLMVGIASQPFWLSWPSPEGRFDRTRRTTPRRVDGSAVVDCRPAERRPARDLAAFEATRRACELLGWEYGWWAHRIRWTPPHGSVACAPMTGASFYCDIRSSIFDP